MTKQDKMIEKLHEELARLEEAIDTYDNSLSSIAGMITAALNEPNLSDWQAKGILRCVLASCAYYADNAKKELGENDERTENE